MRRFTPFVCVCASLLLIAASGLTNFGRLLAQPSHFHEKRVKLRGLAHVDGVSFVLFENAKAAFDLIDSRAVSVAQPLKGPSNDHLNNKWVTIKGIVDAKHHGMWNFPCEILLESIEPNGNKTDGQRIFRNDTSQAAYVSLSSDKTGELAEFKILPNQCNAAVISGGIAVVKFNQGSAIECSLESPQASSLFDAANRAYYYRIQRNQIAPVLPTEVSGWVKHWLDGSPKFY